MATRSTNRPRYEFWERAKELIGWCTPEELRVIRVMTGSEMEKRLKAWDQKLIISEMSKRAKKTKAVKRNAAKKDSLDVK